MEPTAMTMPVSLIVLSHWPHVATHVATQVAAHVCVQRRPLANGTDVRSKMRRQLVWRHVASVKAL